MNQHATCQFCNNTFHAPRHVMKHRKYCSQTCSNKANAKHLSIIRRGSGNPMYKDADWRHRYSYKYNQFRERVFKRDNNTCQQCDKKLEGSQRICHHPKDWKNHPNLRYEVSNGITLCRSCHNKIDEGIKSSQYK